MRLLTFLIHIKIFQQHVQSIPCRLAYLLEAETGGPPVVKPAEVAIGDTSLTVGLACMVIQLGISKSMVLLAIFVYFCWVDT